MTPNTRLPPGGVAGRVRAALPVGLAAAAGAAAGTAAGAGCEGSGRAGGLGASCADRLAANSDGNRTRTCKKFIPDSLQSLFFLTPNRRRRCKLFCRIWGRQLLFEVRAGGGA